MSFWDAHPPEGDFPPMFPGAGGWSAGMSITGTLTKERSYKFEGDDNATPIVELRDSAGNDWSVACGAIRLKAIMYSLRPAVGSVLTITCLGKEGKSLLFDVQVGGAAAPAVAQAPAPAAPQPAAAVAPAPAPAAPVAPAAAPAPAYVPPAAQPAPAPAPAAPAPAPAAPAPGY